MSTRSKSGGFTVLCGVLIVFACLAMSRYLGVPRVSEPSDISKSLINDMNNVALQTASARPRVLVEHSRTSETLSGYASKVGLYVGSMADSTEGNGWKNEWVRQTLASEFNMLEPGTQLKWSTIEPSQSVFDFAPGDEIIQFAASHQMRVRGHNLLWGMANPEWLGNGPARSYTNFSGDQLERILTNHIQTVMGHYREKFPGIVKWWDVTNELMGWNHKFNSNDILWKKIGSNPDRADYARVAFRVARQADPDAILCMNDWGNDGSIPTRTSNMIEAVKTLRSEGVQVDCVGMEAHLSINSAPTYDQIKDVMGAYAHIGVQVQVTEFDVQSPRQDRDWVGASTVATNMLKACVDSPNCTAFNNWGFSQAYYLDDANQPDTVTMLPWDTENQKSPEYSAMLGALRRNED
jgi:endo-1,4-beta-xylanase